MPVPSGLASLSQTAASNSPAGSDAVFPNLDDYLRELFADLARLRDGAHYILTGAAGADTITASCAQISTFAAGQVFSFVSVGANTTTTVTLNINGIGAKNVLRPGGGSMAVGDIPASGIVFVGYNGSNFEHLNSKHASTSDTVSTSRYSTGDVVQSISTTAPTGTVAMDGTTIGDGSSGATSRANSDTLALFTMLWNGASNALLPIQDGTGAASTRGASAAVDFAAHKRMPVPTLIDGQAILAAVTSGTMTASLGALMAHAHSITDPGHTHGTDGFRTSGGATAFGSTGGNMGLSSGTYSATTGITVNSAGAGGTSNFAAGIFLKFYVAL
jgi:hypothetical protein